MLLRLADSPRVNIVGKLLPRYVPSPSGINKTDFRICPQGKKFFFSSMAIF